MKTNSINNRKAAMVIAASFIISALPFAAALAGEKTSTTSVVAATEALPGITAKYLGEKDAQVFIRIALNQPTEQRSYLRIYDTNGELLYEEMLTGKNQAKVIKVSPDELSSLNIVYSTATKEAKKMVVINSLETTRKYDISEVVKY